MKNFSEADQVMRNLKAETEYREAFFKWLASTDQAEKSRLEQTMDALQPDIADSLADPRWKAFKLTVPMLEDAFKGIVKLGMFEQS